MDNNLGVTTHKTDLILRKHSSSSRYKTVNLHSSVTPRVEGGNGFMGKSTPHNWCTGYGHTGRAISLGFDVSWECAF